jgi:hypothetical protein
MARLDQAFLVGVRPHPGTLPGLYMVSLPPSILSVCNSSIISEAGGVRIRGVDEVCAVGPLFSCAVGEDGGDEVATPFRFEGSSVVGDIGVGTPMVTCLLLRYLAKS